MTKKIIYFSFLLLSYVSYSQGKTNSKQITGTQNINQGTYNYSTTYKYILRDGGYGESPTALQMRFKNTNITELTYKGYKASEILNDVSFPINTRFQATVQGNLFISKGSLNTSTNFTEEAVSDGGLDIFYFNKNFIQNVFSTFGKEVTYNDVIAKVTNITLTNISVNKLSDLENKMERKIREIKTLENEKKKENEKKIENKKRKQETEKEVYKNYNSTDNIYDKKQREAREVENKKALEQKQREDETKEFLKQQQLKLEREKEKQDVIANAAQSGSNIIAGGISDGVFTGLELSANFRTVNEDDSSLGIITNTTYELGIVVGAERNGYFSVGYGPAEKFIYDEATGGVFVLGLEFDVFKLGKVASGKYNFRVALGGEFGDGTIEYKDNDGFSDRSWKDEGSYYGGHLSLKLFEILVLKYGIGGFSGETDKRTENEEIKGGYSKFAVGLRIRF